MKKYHDIIPKNEVGKDYLLKKLDQQDGLLDSKSNHSDDNTNNKHIKSEVCKNIEAFDKMKNQFNKSQQVK